MLSIDIESRIARRANRAARQLKTAVGAWPWLAAWLALAASDPAVAQSKRPAAASDAAAADRYIARDQPRQVRFRVGLRIQAAGGAVQRALATTRCPMEWPEQQLELESTDVPSGVQVQTRRIGGTAEQMLLRLPSLGAGSEATCTRTYLLTRWAQRVRGDTRGELALPSTAQTRGLLTPSDGIESSHGEIIAFAAEATRDKSDAWDRVRALFDATRARVQYVEGPFAGALEGLRAGRGDCEEMSCLFIAACRASGIPARMVVGPGHTWSEFALANPDGKLVWLPADPAKEFELGTVRHYTPIFQKGDRFTVPELPGKPHRYLMPVCKGSGSSPVLESIEEFDLVGVRSSEFQFCPYLEQ